MISLDKCKGSCNTADELSTIWSDLRKYILNKTKSINVKVFIMVIRIYETKKLVKHAIVNENSAAQHVIQIKMEFR